MYIINKTLKEKWWLIGLVFTVYLFVALNKLTYASLWFNETIQYYDSKYLFGRETFSWPDKISLYNMVMFIWLNIFDGEWWFRFFGVLMGFLGAVGVYKAVCNFFQYRVAAVAVMIFSTTYRLIYYFQECQEYNLMIALLCWSVYYFILILKNTDHKNLVLFIIFSYLSVWSQYEAIFPVIGMYLTFFIKILLLGNRNLIIKTIKNNLKVYFITVISFGCLLIHILIQNKDIFTRNKIDITYINNSLLKDICHSFFKSFQWNFAPRINQSNQIYLFIFIVSLSVLSIYCIVKEKNLIIRYYIVCNLIVWFLYYFSVKFQLYGVKSFESRENLIFIPFWILYVIIIYCSSFIGLSVKIHAVYKAESEKFQSVLSGICIVLIMIYCFSGWSAIKENWLKEDIRGAVSQWYDVKAYEGNTIVYYAAQTGFSYYFTKNVLYDNTYEKTIKYQAWKRDGSIEEYSRYFSEIYDNKYPDNLYIIASHYGNDLNTMLKAFETLGYKQEMLYDKNGGRLHHVYVSE